MNPFLEKSLIRIAWLHGPRVKQKYTFLHENARRRGSPVEVAMGDDLGGPVEVEAGPAQPGPVVRLDELALVIFLGEQREGHVLADVGGLQVEVRLDQLGQELLPPYGVLPVLWQGKIRDAVIIPVDQVEATAPAQLTSPRAQESLLLTLAPRQSREETRRRRRRSGERRSTENFIPSSLAMARRVNF